MPASLFRLSRTKTSLTGSPSFRVTIVLATGSGTTTTLLQIPIDGHQVYLMTLVAVMDFRCLFQHADDINMHLQCIDCGWHGKPTVHE